VSASRRRGRRLWPQAETLNAARRYLAGPNPEAGAYFLLFGTLSITLASARRPWDEASTAELRCEELRTFSRSLTLVLAPSVLGKLDRRFPRDAKGGRGRWSRLVRYHPDDTAALIAQAASRVGDLLDEEPELPLADRVSRIVVRLLKDREHLPSQRGRRSTWVGRDYDRWMLADYDWALSVLRAAFPAGGGSWRECSAEWRASELRDLAPFKEGPAALLSELAACRTRELAARTWTARRAVHAKVTPGTLKDILRRTRPWARRLEAIEKSQSQ
jgi:hypothetical protein